MKDSNSAHLKALILQSLAEKGISDEVLGKIKVGLSSASLRPLRVIYECCVNDGISTETLTAKYGYNQPPRAARDVRELGFNLKTKFSKTTDGRRMAVYYLDDFHSFSNKEGRNIFSKKEKLHLVQRSGEKCFYCQGKFSPNELQIDHRVPFEIVGNKLHNEIGVEALILVCASCNRSKSWSCEGCENFEKKSLTTCNTCYWFDPDSFSHISGRNAVLVNMLIEEGQAGYELFAGLDREAIRKVVNSWESDE